MKPSRLVFLILLLSGCGKPSAEDSFQAGQAAQKTAEESLGVSKNMQDSLFLRAISFYEAVVDDHPEDPLAEEALFKIAELHNNGTRRFLDAIKAYERFRSIYPASPRAPVSLFMTGFLYNNELHDFDRAAAAYRQFLSLYPNSELAPSASAELENIGKSPEEIIGDKVAAAKGGPKKPSSP